MKNILLCIIICLSLIMQAQTIKIIDKTTRQPLSNVNVYKTGDALSWISGSSGEVTLTNITEGDSLTVSHNDYATATIAYADISDGIIPLAQKSYTLNELVISATRTENSKTDIAQNIAVIDKTEIAFQNSATTADLLQQSGEVLVQKSQFGGGSPVMRGFEASRIVMVIDGVRMNNAIYRAGHLQNIITVDPSLLENVELASGPGSLMYGSDALGGVIHFSTINPELSGTENIRTDIRAFVRYATAANEKTGHLDLNLGGKKFASLTSLSYSDFDDLHAGGLPNKNNIYGSFNFRPFYQTTINGVDTILENEDSTLQIATGYSQIDAMQKFLFRPSQNVSHLLNFQYSTSSDIPRYDRLTDPGDDAGTLAQAEWYYGPQDRMLIAYDLNISSNGKLFTDMRIVASYQDIQESRYTRGFGSSNRTARLEDVTVTGLNIDLHKKTGKHQINYGAELYLNDVTSTAERLNVGDGEITPASTRYPDGGSSMQNLGLYISHILKFGNDKWALNDGIRFNASMLHAEFTDTTFYPFPFSAIDQNSSAITGSFGLVFSPDNTWRIAFIGSTGYRTPNVDDLTKIFDSEPGSLVVPNPELKPEYTYNADLNISKEIAGRVQLEATGFYTIFNNILTTQKSTFNGQDSVFYDGLLSEVRTTVNANKAYIYGMNAAINADITDIISLTTAVTYTYGRIETDTTPYPLDHIPPVYGRTGLNLQFNKCRAEVFALYNGWKNIEDYNIAAGEDNEQYATPDGMPSWYTLNVKAAYQFNQYLHLQAGCENMLDINYRVFASGVAAPGRNIFITLRANI